MGPLMKWTMETLLVISIGGLAVLFFVRHIMKCLKHGGDCSDCESRNFCRPRQPPQPDADETARKRKSE